jgi:hypothetical protein
MQIIFVCNRTRNEHFACLEQAAKLNFAAVALTTAVKVSHFNIYLLSQLQHIYLYTGCLKIASTKKNCGIWKP